MRFRILIEQDEDKMFVAECPSLLGYISQGRNRKEALENIQDAIKGYFESLKKHNELIPPSMIRCQEVTSDNTRSPVLSGVTPKGRNRNLK